MARTFDDKPALRESVPVLFGIMGPSGGGKTFSALRVATGIQRVSGGDIGVIDSEAKRALHYADYFKFRHMELNPPFRSLDYLAAIRHFVDKGVKTVIVDSMSHEHSGAGGYLEYADSELDRMAGDDFRKRQACKLASFIKPSQERRQMIDGILQLKANVIFCFRAKEKVKPLKDQSGKTEITNIGFMPIAAAELVFEMTACCLLLPHAGGVPTWQSEELGEKMMIKTAQQFSAIFSKPQPLSEDIGQQLAEWARGQPAASVPAAGSTQPGGNPTDPTPNAPIRSSTTEELRKATDDALNRHGVAAATAAAGGTETLKTWWATVPAADQKLLKDKLNSEWKATAAAVKQPEGLPFGS